LSELTADWQPLCKPISRARTRRISTEMPADPGRFGAFLTKISHAGAQHNHRSYARDLGATGAGVARQRKCETNLNDVKCK
jgi:hypothetical protein